MNAALGQVKFEGLLPEGMGAKRDGWIIRGSHKARNTAVRLAPRSTIVVAGFTCEGTS